MIYTVPYVNYDVLTSEYKDIGTEKLYMIEVTLYALNYTLRQIKYLLCPLLLEYTTSPVYLCIDMDVTLYVTWSDKRDLIAHHQ